MQPGKFGNYARIPAKMCQRAIDNNTSFEDLATLPSAYCTAFYSIVTIGRLQPGETVMIQSATGGFSLAAIAIARHYGAEIFVTAGSEEKRELLHRMGIARDHIFSSRDISAFTSLKAATDGRGFDLVLNTSSGDYLHQVSWPLVVPFGRFVELKKVDIVDNGILSLKKFNEGVSFIAVDMHYVCEHKPSVLLSLMKIIGAMFRAGGIAPLPVTSFPISKIGDAYGEFSHFRHTSKLVLTYDDEDFIPYIPSPSKPKFYGDAAYLVVGGLSGIGSYLSKWMVQQGIRNIVFLARSGVKGEAQKTVERLRSMGATVTTIQGSVSDRRDVARALTVTGLEVRGIINSALVLRNKEFNKLTVDECHETFAPKVAGNMHLHEISQELGYALDFFVMLSSLTSICHAATQSSYSAANCYMDEFARYRRKRGLTCTSISLGVIGDVGFMSRHSHNMMHLLRNGHYITLPPDLMALFSIALFREEPADAEYLEDVVALGTEPARLRELLDSGSVPTPLWERDPRWDIIGVHAMRKSQGARGGADAARSGLMGDIKDIVADRLSRLLWIPVQKLRLDVSLSALGIDSMIASEFGIGYIRLSRSMLV